MGRGYSAHKTVLRHESRGTCIPGAMATRRDAAAISAKVVPLTIFAHL